MKSKIIKMISLSLCAVLLVGGTAYAFTSSSNKKEKVNKETPVYAEQQQEEVKTENDVYKDETVYVLANADGTIKKIIVSDWIKNSLANDKVEDVTELQNAENIKNDAGYTLGGDNNRVWDAQGQDIYYQGTIEKELPVNMSVAYKLDGQPVSPEELVGKVAG